MAILTLKDLAVKVREQQVAMPNKFCIYGPPGGGKTILAATICEVPDIGKVYWCDLEDGLASVLTATKPDGSAYFNLDSLDKAIYLPIPDRTVLDQGTMELFKQLGVTSFQDNVSNALAAKALLPLLLAPSPILYDVEQRKIVPKANDNTIAWCLKTLRKEDVLIIDSGTQLASSIFSLAMESNTDHNHGLKHWGEFTTNAVAILSAIQAAKCTVIMLCHSLEIEADPKIKRKAQTLPWFGSAPFSRKVGHYFGTVVHMYVEGTYKSLSNPLTRLSVQGKSRFSVDTSLIQNPTMADLLAITERSKSATTHIGAPAMRQASASVSAVGGGATTAASATPGARRPGLIQPNKVK